MVILIASLLATWAGFTICLGYGENQRKWKEKQRLEAHWRIQHHRARPKDYELIEEE